VKLDDMEKGLVALDDGIWVGDLPQAFFGGVRLKVRRIWNDDYAKLYGDLTAALPRDPETNKLILDDARDEEIRDECLKQTVLKDWAGIDDPCDRKAMDKIFSKPALAAVWRKAIISASLRADEVYLAGLKADEKN
jgi:hypothetical protein